MHVEANEGGSSGGHVAIRFGDDVYHFQHERPGVLRLHRHDWTRFRYVYGVLQNRTMRASRAAVPEATYERLRQAFNERYLSERRIFQQRDALADERTLLELLLARRRGEGVGSVSVRAAGFFFPEEDGSFPSPTAVALRARVLDTYGPDAIRAREERIRSELAQLVPVASDRAAREVDPARYPDFPRAFSTRYRDLLTALVALRALDRALPLRPDSYWTAAGADFALDPAQRRTLAFHADRLTGELTRLLTSRRPDWGFAFLVGMARLEALRASAETGGLVLLDAFPPDADVMAPPDVRRHRAALRALRSDAADELAQARASLRSADAIDERAYAALEEAGNRLLELDAALAGDRGLRVPSGALVPSRDAPWAELVVPDLDGDDLARAVTRARADEELFVRRLRDRYGYNLITHNCVSELFRTVDAAGAAPGGHVGTSWSLAFIPFVSARAVNGTWNVVERITLASYRRARVDDMVARESTLAVRLRESNVLTSTVYPRNADDSFFLFFTDDAPALRPLLGTVNLVAGVAAAAAGLPLLPFDRGHLLWSGARGAVFSLPELAFVSLRKGSFDHVPGTPPAPRRSGGVTS